MNNYLLIILFGIFISLLGITFYLWKEGDLTYTSWFNCSGSGILLGFAAIESRCINKSLFSIFIAGYIIYIFILKKFYEKNSYTKRLMLSLFSAVFISISGLIGIILCSC